MIFCSGARRGGDGSPRNTDEKAILHYQQLQLCRPGVRYEPDGEGISELPGQLQPMRAFRMEDTCGTMMSVTPRSAFPVVPE